MSAPLPDLADIVMRLAVATIAGAAVGIEREWRGQLAGMRTHALVALGAALFTLAGAYGFSDISRGATTDPMRVAAQVVSGIGFIGAGAIIRERGAVRGITTAAGLWASAALGMAAAAGEETLVAVGLAAILLTLLGLRLIRDHGLAPLRELRRTLYLDYKRGCGTLAPVLEAVDAAGGVLEQLEIADDDEDRHVKLTMRSRDPRKLQSHLDAIAARPEVLSVRLEPEGTGAQL